MVPGSRVRPWTLTIASFSGWCPRWNASLAVRSSCWATAFNAPRWTCWNACLRPRTPGNVATTSPEPTWASRNCASSSGWPTTYTCCFVLLAGGWRRLPEANVRRFRNRLRGLRARWGHGRVTQDEVDRRVGAWVAHAAHAHTWRLRHAIFRDGVLPSREPDRPPVYACCVAGPGTTHRGTSAPRIATGTPPGIGTTITGSVSLARSVA